MPHLKWIVIGFLALAPSVGSAADPELDSAMTKLVHGDWRGAEPLLRDSIASHPNLASTHFELATTLRLMGREREAVPEYQETLRLSQDRRITVDALYGLALARDTLGDANRASQAWSEYIQFADRNSDLASNLTIARQHLKKAQALAK